LSTDKFGFCFAANEHAGLKQRREDVHNACLLYGIRDLSTDSIIIEKWSICISEDLAWANSVVTDGTNFFVSFYIEDAALSYTSELLLFSYDKYGNNLSSAKMNWNGDLSA